MQHFMVTTTVILHHTEAFVLSLDLDSRGAKKKFGMMKKARSHSIK